MALDGNGKPAGWISPWQGLKRPNLSTLWYTSGVKTVACDVRLDRVNHGTCKEALAAWLARSFGMLRFTQAMESTTICMSTQLLPSLRSWCVDTGLAAALLAIGLSACSKPPVPQEPVRSVKVLTVGIENLASGAEFAGEVRARIELRPGFRVAGKIVQRPVEAGQRVKAGQLIAQLDAQDFRLAAEAARAQVNVAAINRNVNAAEFKRYQELKEQNFISGIELDRRDTSLKASEAQLEQAQAQLSAQRNQATYTNLMADSAGVVLSVEAEAGQVVAAGTPIVRIAKDGPRDVVFSVPEDKVALIKPGSVVDVRSWSGGPALKGVVREVAASADPVTRTFQIKVSLDIQDGTPVPSLGSTVYVVPQALARSGVSVIKLPTSALKQDGKTTAVWLLDPVSMTVKSQAVDIATADGNEAVISAGLRPGMLVVAAGVHVLQAGQKVTLYREKSAADAPVGQTAAQGASSGPGSVALPAPPKVSAPVASASK